MPSYAAPTLRPRAFHRVLHRDAKPQHGHWSEYVVQAVGVANNVGFLVASFMFYSSMPTAAVVVADWIFIIGSLVGVAIGLHHIHEAHDWDHLSEMANLTGKKSRKRLNEFLEHVNFVVASFVFFVGSIFFMPGIYGDDLEAERRGEGYGARCFIAGSFLMVLAAFFAAVAMATDPEHQQLPAGSVKLRCHYLYVVGLASSQLGSVCFVTGSVLFRPVFEGTPLAADIGCDYYVVGSAFYVLESVLQSYSLFLKHQGDHHDQLPLVAPDGASQASM